LVQKISLVILRRMADIIINEIRVTDEERHWVRMLCEGKTYKQIADEMSLKRNAVAYRLTALRERYNCVTSNQLVYLFTKNKIVD